VSKINVWGILVAHFDTFRDSRGEWYWPDFLLFVGVPIAFSGIGVFYFHWALYVDALNAMLSAFSIFAGLLLNLLILIYTFPQASQPFPVAVAKARITFIHQLHSNLAFAVLLSVVIAVTALAAVSEVRMYDTGSAAHTGKTLTFALTLLTANFVLTLLMILKRIHAILMLEVEKTERRKAL
jgi:hypothetical protein